jgi:DNA-binding response OmpR family regulator
MTKLLIVDDEIEIANSLKKYFDARGYDTFVAYEGEAALSVFNKQHPQLVFLDIRMKGTDGFEILSKIKEIDISTKVIMVTALDEPGSHEKAKQLGCDGYITKPYSVKFLETVVSEIISEMDTNCREFMEMEDK